MNKVKGARRAIRVEFREDSLGVRGQTQQREEMRTPQDHPHRNTKRSTMKILTSSTPTPMTAPNAGNSGRLTS
ncbi:hypothetical protein MHBO_005221 [Bonamia ostreae]|uniref:Uncharacterized protein n=1 Tax=Bonamia ostreae TaxID=126728 RepID=A0ABV2AVD4_9EUKA